MPTANTPLSNPFSTFGKLTSLILVIVSTCFINACATTLTPQANNSSTADMPNMQKEPTIALVLGGGGARGFAHVGVIKTLESNGIRPNLIVGSSAGSLIGSLYASGKTANELEHLALTTADSELTDFTLSYQGIIEGIKLKNFINQQVAGRPIEQMPIKLAIVATEKHTQKKTVFTQGDTGLIVQASSSVPNLFIAPRIPEKVGKKYVDGGVSSLVPVDSAKELGADVIIAVDVLASNAPKPTSKNPYQPSSPLQLLETGKYSRNLWSLIEQSYQSPITSEWQYQNTGYKNAEIRHADVVIRPKLAHISVFDTTRREEMIKAGETATKQQLSAIKQAIQNKTPSPK